MTTPTPETDAAAFEADTKIDHRIECVTADHARNLERRLIDSQAECERLREELEWAVKHGARVSKSRSKLYYCVWNATKGPEPRKQTANCATPRDAIRAAMQVEAQGEPLDPKKDSLS